MDAKIVKKTQDTLGKVIKKPPLTEKLLNKPPFRFLHDVITEVIRNNKILLGLYNDGEMNSANVTEKEAKTSFLQKAIDCVGFSVGEALNARPSKIVAGHEPEKTNEFLQALGKICIKKIDTTDSVKKVLAGDKPSGKKKRSRSATKEDDGKAPKEKDSKNKIKEEDVKKSKDENKDEKTDDKKEDRRKKSKDRKSDAKEGEGRERRKDKEGSKEERKERKSSSEDREGSSKDREGNSKEREGNSKDREGSSKDREGSSKEREGSSKERKRSSKERDGSSKDKGESGTEKEKSRRERKSRSGHKEKSSKEKGDKEKENSKVERSKEKDKKEKEPDKVVNIQVNEDEDVNNNSENELDDGEGSGRSIQRPSSAKGQRRPPSDKDAVEQDKENDVASSETKSAVPDTNQQPPQRQQSDVRRPARPSSARPAPPKLKKSEPAEDQPRGGSGKPIAPIIMDTTIMADEDDEDDTFVVEEDPALDNLLEVKSSESNAEFINTQEHGSLVRKMLESKKEADSRLKNNQEEKPVIFDAARKKEREMAEKEIEKLRGSIQHLVRSAHPLGKIMDYIQEDIDSMQKELNVWKDENKRHEKALKAEQNITESEIEPMQAHLAELELDITEMMDNISTVKSNILRNEEKIEDLVMGISR